ncbi:SDR family oxidoreductase [Leptospira fluminis]|uniref:SDR family oxidoreductase n=1 Tax=Leptospira fluminis TaxID=2484979 RepID=A0A4R9GM95_9LEPT|nr:SDR family oxidoreductase [Leptospira fluminis]TGK17277.1 SDR family oxidoreductase [Leptospira fluminis]
MKILITGNLGYIGPVLVEHLRKEKSDLQLAGFDTGFFTTNLIRNEILPEIAMDIQYFGDVRKFPEEILKGVHSIVYLSAISNDPMGKEFEAVTESINARCAVDLAKIAKRNGVTHFVFASSCSVYGFAEGGAKDEDSALNPLTAYARSKIEAENLLQELADQKFIITAHRFATACGFSPRLRLDLVLNDFVASACTAKRINILSDGTPWRPLIHVKDMAKAIEWSISRPYSNGGAFLSVNTGANSWNFQVKDLAVEVAKIIGNVDVSINSSAPPDNRSYRVNFDKFSTLAPQFVPQMDLAKTIEEIYAGLREANFTDSDFRNSTFMRLNKLKQLKSSGLVDEHLYWRRHT